MVKRALIGLAILIFQFSAALADFPSHADLCVEAFIKGKKVSIISKAKLAKAFVNQSPNWSKLFIDANEDASERRFSPQWRRIFTDPKFCVNDPGCLGPPAGQAAPTGSKRPLDSSAAMNTLNRLRFDFRAFIQKISDGGHYANADPDIGTNYLLGDDAEHPIYCVGTEVPTAPKATVLKLPIRLRASSDDLNIDADRDKDLFKSSKPATVTFTRDGTQKSNATKLQAAVGYAIPLAVDATVQTSGYFNGELVPYISANESITKVDGKAPSYADTNNVAIGTLLNAQFMFNDYDLNNVISVKPQYLWNTKDKSEIASLRFIYQPWTYVLNKPKQIGDFFGANWLTLLFDLRNDFGDYTKKGVIPALARMHTSFDRAGSKFGIAFSTDPSTAHLVLTITETLLYGYGNNLRRLDLFDSTLSYYFDSTSNFGFTVSYTKGQNEDTAVSAQTFTAGFSAKF